MLSVMILYSVMNVALPCSFWNCITGTSAFLWKKCTRKQCPVLVESGPPHDFQNTLQRDIILLEESANEQKEDRGTAQKIYKQPS